MPVESKKPQIQSKSKRSAAIFGALDHQRVIQLVKICSYLPKHTFCSLIQSLDPNHSLRIVTTILSMQLKQQMNKCKKQTNTRNKHGNARTNPMQLMQKMLKRGHVVVFLGMCLCFVNVFLGMRISYVNFLGMWFCYVNIFLWGMFFCLVNVFL